MKHRLLHTMTGVAALLLLFGCQAEEELLTAGSKGIRIAPTLQTQAAGASTRTVAGVESFSENDVIGISIAKGDETPAVGDANHPYKYAAGTWAATGSELYWTDETSEHTLRAYYPYDEKAYAAAATTADFTLPLNEAGDIDMTADAYAAADKAWGKVEAMPTVDAVTIGMTHRMAQVIISLTVGEGVASVDNMTVELLAPTGGFAQVGTFNILDGSVSAAAKQPDAKPQKLQMLKAADGKFYALVIPGQTFKAGEAFARIKDAAGKQYIYKLAMDAAADLVTASNQPVRFNLTVATKAVSGMGVTAEEWGTPTEIVPEGTPEPEPEPEPADAWLASLTVVECSGGDLETKLGDLTEEGRKKVWIKGTLNATDIGAYNGTLALATGLNKFIRTYNIADLCLDADLLDGNSAVTTTLPNNILKACSSLETVRLMRVTATGTWLFTQCTAIKTVVMPELTAIALNSFNGETTLETVILPKANSISGNAFNGCTSLTTLVLKDKGSFPNSNAFSNVSAATLSLFLVSPAASVVSNETLGTNYGTWTPPSGTAYNFNTIHGSYTGDAEDYNAYLKPENYKYSWTRP